MFSKSQIHHAVSEVFAWSTRSNFSKCFLAFLMLIRVAADAENKVW